MSFYDAILAKTLSGGGGGGTSDYTDLTNKPQINSVTLTGNKSTADLIPIDKGLEIDTNGKLAVALGDGLDFNQDGEIETTGSYIPTSEKGVASGVATLNESGQVPATQLPSYVDDIIDGYLYEDKFYEDAQHTTEISGEDGKIYVDLETNLTYRWATSQFVEISKSLALGDTASTAYYGDKGKIAYDHSQVTTGNPHHVTAAEVNAVPTSEKAAANGVATLDGSGIIPDTQLPTYTGNKALVSDVDGKVSASGVSNTELGYLSGVTENIQTQINGKQNTLTFDSTPTASSNNPVTSGGIKSYIDEQGAKTVSGNPITITDAEGMNADHVIATITPTQTGSDTPSPINVRPFTGFSSVDINVADAPTDPTETKTYTVQLGDTYYGGTLDVTSGKLVIDHGFVDIGSLNFDGKEGSENCALFRTAFNSISNPLLGNINYVGTSKCSCFKYDSGTNVTGLTPETINVGYSSSPRVRVSTEYYKSMSVAEFKTAMSGQKLCYELGTPVEIQLTPTQIELLENNNTITTNVTSLDIKYQANTTIGDTLSVLDKRVTSLETKVPQPPTTDGTYKLTVTVASGEPTYSWESAT